MDNFNVHEWNKNRYLNRIKESDDPKMGAELEAGVEGDRVEENKSHLEFLSKYLGSMYPDLRFDVSDFDDIRVYGSQQDLANFGRDLFVNPNRSDITNICASQSGPAPIPMVGIEIISLIFLDNFFGIHSRTTAKAPDFSIARAYACS